MRKGSQAYNAIPTFQISTREVFPWYWRFLAFAASWMILGGYITISATFDSEPKLRTSKNALLIVSIGLMTAGYSLSALLCFAHRNWLYGAQDLLLPPLASSTLGLLSVVYPFLISTRYEWGKASTITTVIAASTSIIYASLLLYAQRKLIRFHKRYSTDSNFPLSHPHALQSVRQDGAGSYLNGSGSYTLRSDASSFSAHRWSPHDPTVDEAVDPTVSNLRTLLSTAETDYGTSPSVDIISTYRIALPENAEEAEDRISRPGDVREYNTSGRKGLSYRERRSNSPPCQRVPAGSDLTTNSSGLGLGIVRTDRSTDGEVSRPSTLPPPPPRSRGRGGVLNIRLPLRAAQAEKGKGAITGRQRAGSTTSVGDERWRDRQERRREIESPYTRSAGAVAGQWGGPSREDRRREIELGFR